MPRKLLLVAAVVLALGALSGGIAAAGDDGAAYDVEGRRADGSRVEVRLDARFGVIGREEDDDGAGHEETEGEERLERLALSPRARGRATRATRASPRAR
jgi:hypothetical protein